MTRRTFRRAVNAGAVATALWVAAQFVPVARTNPPAPSPVSAPFAVEAVPARL